MVKRKSKSANSQIQKLTIHFKIVHLLVWTELVLSLLDADCVNLDVENRRFLRKNSFAILPCTENVCKWLIDAAIQYVGRYPVERKVIWSDRNSEISFIKLNK